MLESDANKPLVNMTLTDFTNETASESPAPGGGSISAYCGAMGVALGTMVANLSAHKRGWDDRWEEFSNWAEKGMEYQNALLELVDEDTNAFNKIMNAFRLPKDSEEEKAKRQEAIQAATKNAILTPHTAFFSQESLQELSRRTAQQVKDVLEGKLPENLRNPEVLNNSRKSFSN